MVAVVGTERNISYFLFFFSFNYSISTSLLLGSSDQKFFGGDPGLYSLYKHENKYEQCVVFVVWIYDRLRRTLEFDRKS